MRVFERWLSVLVLGAIAPIGLFLVGWWGSLALLGDGPWIPALALGGLSTGLALDLTVLRRRLGSLYSLPTPASIMIALFYSIGIYGFFMGLPVPNLAVGIGWGFAVGRRHAPGALESEVARRDLRIAAVTSAVIMSVLCCATAWMALNEPTIASQMRGMLGLPFTPSIHALRAVSLLGGIALVATSYVLPGTTAWWAAHLPAPPD